MIASFGDPGTDEDPIDLTFVPETFAGTLGGAGLLAVADRGLDGNASNAITLVDPTTTELNQAGYADISGALTVRTLTDVAPPVGQAFYRIEATE